MKDADLEIDRAVRSMLDAEPSDGFRARVMAAIRTEEPPRRWMSWALPLGSAAVAILVVSVFMLSRQPGAPQIVAGRDVRLAAPAAQIAEQVPPAIARAPILQTVRAVRPRAVVRTRALEEPVETGIDALTAPAPLAVGTLPMLTSTTMESIQPAPLRVTALDLPALELPRDAARGDER